MAGSYRGDLMVETTGFWEMSKFNGPLSSVCVALTLTFEPLAVVSVQVNLPLFSALISSGQSTLLGLGRPCWVMFSEIDFSAEPVSMVLSPQAATPSGRARTAGRISTRRLMGRDPTDYRPGGWRTVYPEESREVLVHREPVS